MVEKRKILVVDDEKSVSEMLTMLLETRGYDVKVATTGHEALETVAEKPDLILLDLMLPDMEGYKVCEELRNNNSTRQIPIIILSAKYLFQDKVKGLYLGADDYMTKPFDCEELFARIEVVLRRTLPALENNSDRHAIITEIKNIVTKKLINPFYQPIFWLKPFKMFGLEVLSRPPKTSTLSNPEVLFKAALQFGLYTDLEMFAWSQALKNHPQFKNGEKIFFNCNPYLIESPDFFKIKAIFNQWHVPLDQVILEVTERSAICNFKLFCERLEFFRRQGFSFAIDDVGGGYASLESIAATKPRIIKIDHHIVHNIHKDSIKRSLVKFLVTFCKENSIISVAEGIEQREDFDILMQMGVDAAQGFLLCEPTTHFNLSKIYQDIQSRLGIPTPSIE